MVIVVQSMANNLPNELICHQKYFSTLILVSTKRQTLNEHLNALAGFLTDNESTS